MDREQLVALLEQLCELAIVAGENDVKIVLNSLAIALREGCEDELAQACIQFAAQRQARLN